MFDADHGGGSDCAQPEPENERPARRQYTLKGVEEDTIKLMRVAADCEGMKIGAWVSLRMKEAAQKALERKGTSERKDSKLNLSQSSVSTDETFQMILKIVQQMESQRIESQEKFLKIENEIHQITSGQRAIMTKLLSS